MMTIWQTRHMSSVKHFFVFLRSNDSLVRLKKMVWFYPTFDFLKSSEFAHIHTSNVEFYWSKSKVWSTLILSRMESLVFFQAFKPLDDVCVVHPITIITSTSHCVPSLKPSSNIFYYSIVKKSTFSYLIKNRIIFYTSKVYFSRLWVAMVTSYMSGIVIFIVKWYGTQPQLRVWGSNLHGDLTKNKLKLLLLTLNTLTCSDYISFHPLRTIQTCQLSYFIHY